MGIAGLSWRKEREAFITRKCPVVKKPCAACRSFDALVVATRAGMAYWLMNSMWRKLHGKLHENRS